MGWVLSSEAPEGQGTGTSLPLGPCLQIRQALELRLGCPLQQYRDFIDNQMLLLMAQQDRASRIFPHLYLVSTGCGAWEPDPFGCCEKHSWRPGNLVLLSCPTGL
jgi:hypothetical protein